MVYHKNVPFEKNFLTYMKKKFEKISHIVFFERYKEF